MYRVVVSYRPFAQYGNNLAFDQFITNRALKPLESSSLGPEDRMLVFLFKTKEGAEKAKKRIKATGRLLRVHVYED